MGDEQATYKQSEAGGEYSTPYVRGGTMTAGIGTAMDDINSSFGMIVTPNEACLPFDYANIGIVQHQLEVGIESVRWHLGKGV